MGSGTVMRCPKCGFEFQRMEGVGMLYPIVYEETMKKAREGELGKVLKNFFDKNSDGVLNVEQVALCCDQCGALSLDKDLTMYTPKNKAKNGHGSEDSYVSSYELAQGYSEYMKYPHKCEKCGGNMHRIKDDEILKCPDCKVTMEEVTQILWD